MTLKERTVQDIRYFKSKDSMSAMGKLVEGEHSKRSIIPTFVPKQNIKAIDVSLLSENERDNMLKLLLEYNEYVNNHSKSLFSFEDWASHNGNQEISPRWRTFKIENIEIL